MSSFQPVKTAAVVAALAHAGCDRAATPNGPQVSGTVTLVNRVSASVRGDNCATCASTLEAALIKRLNAVDANVSFERHTVDLEFAPGSPFASVSFREAVEEARAEVQRVEIEACGTIATTDGQSWIKSGSARLLLDGPGPFVTGAEVCVTGELLDLQHPPKLVPVMGVKPAR